VPTTALQHFEEDIQRARAIATHADPVPQGTAAEQVLRSDLLRSAWMFAVGALDAYFCDAYTDLVAVSIISKSRHAAMALPDFFLDIKFPVRAILESYANNFNWRWRMAARQMMADESVISLEKIRDLFNKFFRPNRKLFHQVLSDWIVHDDARKRVFGITRQAFLALPTDHDRRAAVGRAWEFMKERFRTVFQRRHDCIHNCDRPKVSPQRLVLCGTVINVIEDVQFLVKRCNAHINTEFREFLLGSGCTAAVVAQAGY
jgi:hypothetical protein